MLSVAFDTLKFAQTLRDKAKFSPEQAEGISQAFAEASLERLATKADISDIRAKLEGLATRLDGFGARLDGFATKAELREGLLTLRNDFRTEIAPMKAEQLVIKWMLGFPLAMMVAALFLLLKR